MVGVAAGCTYPVQKPFTYAGRAYQRGDVFDAADVPAPKVRDLVASRLLAPAAEVMVAPKAKAPAGDAPPKARAAADDAETAALSQFGRRGRSG